MSTTLSAIDQKPNTAETRSNILAPKLRFKEFDGFWKKSILDNVAKRGSGHTPSKNFANYYNGGIKWVSLADSKKLDNGYIEDTEIKISLEGIKKSSAVLHPKESVLLSRDAGVGKSAVMKSEMAVSQHFIVWQGKDNLLSNWFLYHILQILKPEFERIAVGSTIKTIGLPYFKKLEIVIPTLPEQQKIASFLSAVDEKIQQLTRKKELLEQYKKGVMQNLFSGKLRFKDENGENFPDWEEKRLGDVAVINPKSSALPESFVYIDLESVENGQLLKENTINKTEAPSRAQRKLSINDILYQTVRPYQMNNLLFKKEGDYVASTGYAQLRAKESSTFLFQLLHTEYFVNNVLDRCTGTSYPSINSTDLSEIKILMPRIEEQQKIASYLSSLDTKIESVGNQITQTQTYKKGLLQQLFV